MTPPDNHTPQSESSTGLQRSMRGPGLTIHYITSVMGVGILVLPGLAGTVAGPLSLVAWLVLVLWSYPFALVFARLSVALPKAGGVAEFVQEAFGTMWSRRVSIFLLLTLIIANPLLGLASGRYLAEIIAPDASNCSVLVLGFIVILATVIINLFGLRASARLQGATLIVLVAFLLLTIALALPSTNFESVEPFAPQGWAALGPAILLCFFGFIGWENAAPVAEEVSEPERTFPRAIAAAVVIVGVLYLLMASVIVLNQPATGESVEGLTAFSGLLQQSFGPGGTTFGQLVAFLLMALTANAWCLGTSRVVFSAARSGLLPKRLEVVDSRGTPRGAVIFLGFAYGLTVLALFVLDLDESTVVTITSASFLIIFLSAVFAGLRILEGRMRVLAGVVIVVTIVLLPFFWESLPWALVLATVSVVLELIARRRLRAQTSS